MTAVTIRERPYHQRTVYRPAPEGWPGTDATFEMLRLRAAGLTSARIAEQTGRTVATIDRTLAKARASLGARTVGDAIRAARRWLDMPPRDVKYPPVPADCPLTAAELEMVRRQARGQTYKQMAYELAIATDNPHVVLGRARRKLGCRGRLDLALATGRAGWLGDEIASTFEQPMTATQLAYDAAMDRWLPTATLGTLLLGEGAEDEGDLAGERRGAGTLVCREAGVTPWRGLGEIRLRPQLVDTLLRVTPGDVAEDLDESTIDAARSATHPSAR